VKKNDVLSTIKSIDSVEDIEQLELLQSSLDNLFVSPKLLTEEIEVLFGLYEKFPISDGYGAFWSILHKIEASDNYKTLLIESIQRQPTLFTLLMIERILNSKVYFIGDINLLNLLTQVANDKNQLEDIHQDAQDFIESFKNIEQK
jgi:hypothetical protein